MYSEYSPNGSRNKVDIALKYNYKSLIFIEIKSSDKLSNKTELEKAEIQLRNYNVDLTALFNILTDGNMWRFYYSQEGGTFSEKCFKVINMQVDDSEDLETVFHSFLSKENVSNGNSKREAFEYLKSSRKQQIMEESIPASRRLLEVDYLLTPVAALQKVVKERTGIEVSSEEALELFLKLEKQKREIKNLPTKAAKISTKVARILPQTSNVKKYTLTKPFNMKFTSIESSDIEGESANVWIKLLRILISQLYNENVPIQNMIASCKMLNIKYGVIKGEKGFRHIPRTEYSLQNIEATKVAEAMLRLATKYNKRIKIVARWDDKPKAQFPGEQCIIEN